jgi:alkyl sulfatase BDS1-like metallo-beta-lactamase superfamily hydrolase
LLESISEKLVILKDDKETAFDHMSEVLEGLIYSQELAVVRTVLLLSGAELME